MSEQQAIELRQTRQGIGYACYDAGLVATICTYGLIPPFKPVTCEQKTGDGDYGSWVSVKRLEESYPMLARILLAYGEQAHALQCEYWRCYAYALLGICPAEEWFITRIITDDKSVIEAYLSTYLVKYVEVVFSIVIVNTQESDVARLRTPRIKLISEDGTVELPRALSYYVYPGRQLLLTIDDELQEGENIYALVATHSYDTTAKLMLNYYKGLEEEQGAGQTWG